MKILNALLPLFLFQMNMAQQLATYSLAAGHGGREKINLSVS